MASRRGTGPFCSTTDQTEPWILSAILGTTFEQQYQIDSLLRISLKVWVDIPFRTIGRLPSLASYEEFYVRVLAPNFEYRLASSKYVRVQKCCQW
jgi:hypothetical protein